MRFFRRELWLETQSRAPLKENNLRWREAFSSYRAQLESLRPRLKPDVFEFFSQSNLHDGELLGISVVDGSRPAPLDCPIRPWFSPRNHPVKATLTALEASDQFVWELSYLNLRRALVDYPTIDPLFHTEGDGFGDWGYDELTDAGGGFLRHEVLFASGSTLLFEFGDILVTRIPRASGVAT